VESQVEEIKKKLDIVDVINRFTPLKKRGHHYIACCPFHQEKTPSFIVSPELQIFKCFGCGKAGDIFTFVEEFERVDFKEALEELAKMAGIELKHDARLAQSDSRRQRLFLINHEVAKFYHYILTEHPLGKNALAYVLNRGINLETIKLFKIGFSPPNPQLITTYLTKKSFALPELIASGSFGQSNYGRGQLYDRFAGRLVFPLADFRDRILGFSGRVLPGSKPEMAKYINSPETDIYHKSQTVFGLNLSKEFIKKQATVIVTEGEFDMISPFQAGFKNIVAIKGTAFTADQLQLLRRYADTLILALDSDFAGNNAARKSIELADSFDFDIQVLTLGEFKDPDEAVQKDSVFFKKKLENPIAIWDYLIDSAVSQNDPSTVRGKKQILTTVLPFISKIGNSVIRSDYLHKLADAIGSTVESVTQESLKVPQPVSQKPETDVLDPPVITPDSRLDRLEQYLLSLIFSAKKPEVLARRLKKKYSFSTSRFLSIFTLLLKQKNYHLKTFAAQLPPELQSIFQDIYIASSALNLEPLHRRLEITKIINLILSQNLKKELQTISHQLSLAEKNEDSAKIKELETKYNQLLAGLSGLESNKI
jgi:DNA primase